MHNRELTAKARDLRKNMTKEERKLWFDFLKPHPSKFYAQRVIDCYIVDFYCPSSKLIIEIDGSQHYQESGQNKDKIRDKYLSEAGYTVVRITNYEIHTNFRGVCRTIDEIICNPSSMRNFISNPF